MSGLLSVFRERNYSFFFTGQALSFIGNWMQSTTFNWLLYQFTDSPFLLGSMSAAINIPLLILIPYAGSMVDRFDHRRLLLFLQTIFMIHASLLGALAYFDLLNLTLIVAMGCIQSFLNAFDGPARQALVPQLLNDRSKMPAAIALNSVMVNTTRTFGPPLAGWILTKNSSVSCFLLNALSYFFMLLALMALQFSNSDNKGKHREYTSALDNLLFIVSLPSLRYLFISYIVVAVATMSVYVLLPIWSADILKAGPQGLGLMMGGIGAGALLGAIIVGSQSNQVRLWLLFRYSSLLLGFALILISSINGITPIIMVTVMLGMAYIGQSVAANTLLQMSVDDSRRGGIMAFYLLVAFGSIPVGNVLGGWLGHIIGLKGAAMTAGITVLISIFFLWRTSSRVMQLVFKEN
ncbi:MAG: MFS transporter [Desulfobacterales bacterium]|nr:MFS transporter [Desulfobacterales bacterium]MBF0397541.1 MFS transporter [Desulfobacterales bacterium]